MATAPVRSSKTAPPNSSRKSRRHARPPAPGVHSTRPAASRWWNALSSPPTTASTASRWRSDAPQTEERMVTMIDEIYDRNYQAHRAELNAWLTAGVARLGHAIGNAFAVLNRIEYSEPWAPTRRKARSR